MIAFWRKSKKGNSARKSSNNFAVSWAAASSLVAKLGGGLLLLPIVVLVAYHFAYRGRIYPKVEVAGVDLSNTTVAEAESLLDKLDDQAMISRPALTLVYDGNEWNILKAEIKFRYTGKDTANTAYQVGRSGNVWWDLQTKWRAWFSTEKVPISFAFDERLLNDRVASIAAEILAPPIPPAIEVLDRPQVSGEWIEVHEGESGHQLQTEALNQVIRSRFTDLSDEPINLPVETVTVDVTATDISLAKQRAEKLVKRKLVLAVGDQSWNVGGQEMINFIDLKGGFDVAKVNEYVINLAKSVDRAPQNAAFQYVDGKVVEFRPAKDGLALMREVVVKDVVEALAELENGDDEVVTVQLAVDRDDPEITLAEVNNLGIKELLGKGMSTYKGSIAGRIYNVGLSASRINGALVPPGETFSFNNQVGEISGTTGYQPAYVIRSGATVLDDGGGVCQTSSTLFRAVLNAGLPIVERKAHSYRVGYYEQNAKAGLDATVFAPTADLKFLNDTPGHLLIQTSANSTAQTLAIEIYGTGDGRSVEITNHKIWDVVPAPPPRYQDDPSLPAGATKQVDWAAAGAKAKFDYIVRRNGEVIINKTFLSVYRPWQAVYLRGVAAN